MKLHDWAAPFLMAALGVSVTAQPPASAQLLGPEFQVNSYETGYQEFPAVAADAVGNFVVVWTNTCAYCAVAGIFGRSMDATGAPAGAEFQVNTYTTNVQGFPAVAADALGNFVVVWASQSDGAQMGVSGRRFDAAAVPLGGEFQVNSFTTSDQRSPAIATDGSGNFVVVWISYGQDGNGFGVFGQRFSSSGSPLGLEFQVNSFTTAPQFVPSVAANAAGDFVVVWPSVGQDGDGWGVFGQRFSSAGVPQGLEFQVNSFTTGDQLYPRVATNASGAFVVAWQSVPQDGDNQGVFGQRFNAAGLPQGAEFQVNSYTTNAQYRPAVAANAAGDFVVTWDSKFQDGAHDGIIGRRFSSSGAAVGSDFQINAFTTGGQQLPVVAADGTGSFVVVWQSPHDGSYTGIFGRQMTVPIFAGDFARRRLRLEFRRRQRRHLLAIARGVASPKRHAAAPVRRTPAFERLVYFLRRCGGELP